MRAPLLALTALLPVACGGDAPAGALGPVLLIGVDGLEPSIVADLMAEGRLPTLRRFAREGTLARLATLEPTYSPVIWTTIATGQDAAAHGVDFFVDLDGNGLPYTSESRQVPALWNLASDAGLAVDVVGWWVSWPAEPINGRVLASYAAQAQAHVIWKAAYDADRVPEQTWPEDLWDVVREDIVFADDHAAVQARFASRFPAATIEAEPVPRITQDLAWTLSADHSNLAVAERFLGDDPGDLVMVYLALPDVAGHRFWRYHAPGDFPYDVPAEQIAALGETVRLAYEDVDAALGRLLAGTGDDWSVVLVSDHGMHADPDTLDDPRALNSGHHLDGPPGVVGALGRGVASLGDLLGARPIGGVLDVAPTVLRLLGVAQPEHWPSVPGPNGLEALLARDFARAHPVRTQPSPDAAWRRAHPRAEPRAPTATANQDFVEMFDALGYLVTENLERSDDP